ncbi:MAG: WG repeat-containing protein, partial [Muribaculaceae bacterium]|nr:WG repeat-containing protein [Muribaculaceae bacterium]
PVIYEDLFAMANNMWAIKYNGKMGVINSNGAVVVPTEYAGVEIYPKGGIVVMLDDNSKKRLDYDGSVTDDFVCDHFYALTYSSGYLDDADHWIRKPANLGAYSCDDHYGLIDMNGRPITPPLYYSIEAISADLFECQIDECGECLIINAKGQKVN